MGATKQAVGEPGGRNGSTKIAQRQRQVGRRSPSTTPTCRCSMRCATIWRCTARASAAGSAQCGACTVHVDGKAVRSCVMPLSSLGAAEGRDARRPRHAAASRIRCSRPSSTEQAAQCGYCINGMIMESAGLPRDQQEADRGADQEGARQQPVPLRHACPHRRARSSARRQRVREAAIMNMHFVRPAATCSRAAARWSSASRSPARSATRSRKARPPQSRRAHRGRHVPRDRRARAWSRSIPARSISAPACAPRCAQIVAEELDVPLRHGHVIERRHRADARPGARPMAACRSRSAACRSAKAAATARSALLDEAAKRLGAKPEDAHGRRRRHQRAAASASATRELIGGKTFCAQARQPSRPQPRIRRTTRSSASRCRASTSRTRSPAASPTCRTSACPACCTAAWCARRRSARRSKASTRARSRTSPASSRWCARAISSASSPTNEWGAIKARAEAQGDVVEIGDGCPTQAKLWEHVRATKVAKDEVTSNVGDSRRRRMAQGAKAAQGDLRFRHPHPRLDRAVLRGGRVQGRQADLVVGLAGDAQSAQAAAEMFGDARRGRALHLCRRRRLLRPQRPRGCRGRCRAARQGGAASRCACSGRAPTSTAGTRRARRR